MANHQNKAELDGRMSRDVESVIPKKRQDVLKWYGWGYKDSKFYVKDGMICFQGDQYPLEGCTLPYFTEWVNKKFDIIVNDKSPYPEMPKTFPHPTTNHNFVNALKDSSISLSSEGEDRLIRCHGQTLHDIYLLWKNAYQRIPDLVVWPKNHEEVSRIVSLANENNIVLIPYGGGTSVSGSITCPQEEERMICVVDTSQMNHMLWLNKENLTVCFESGIVGQDLERELRKLGLTVGHEPDSYEFSTLGGWVATRASGMKKNVYGNIEDLIVKVKMVTTRGTLERECSAPRVSSGPDFNHIIMGSEGTLGIVTEVVLKVRPLPPVKRYGSLVFPDFDSGVMFMREVARRRCQPASVRLMDNEQFEFGQSLKPIKGLVGNLVDYFKKAYVSKIKGIDLSKMCAATLLFEGERDDVSRQEALIYEIAKRFKGFPAGGQNGERGYILTFVIAYIRDFALNHQIVAESFETSVAWDRCSALCKNVKQRVRDECKKHTGLEHPVETYEAIECGAREEILSNGGSISHHHGVGKLRNKWYKKSVSETGLRLYETAKKELDPKNIFALGNLVPEKTTDSESAAVTSKL